MELDTAARMMAQLGNRARLEVLRLLIRSGHDGLSVGRIQEHLEMPASTLAFHLRGLVGAGLVVQAKEGRVVTCRASFEALDAVTAFLREECCVGLPSPRRQQEEVA